SWGRAFQRPFFLLAWCASGALLSLFLPANINRLNVAILPLLGCAALAASVLWSYRPLSIALSAMLGVSALGFTSAYFSAYAWQAAPAFLPGLVEAARAAAARTDADICVTDRTNMPYIYVLFATAPEPYTFYESVVYANPGAEFQRVTSFGRYHFGAHDCPESARVILTERSDTAGFRLDGFSSQPFGSFMLFSRQ
ncbi:MAG TPA: hypothetical protein VJU61_20210, partial [Polyangiaceae bacterium]|nr:hypothetical protein [Polyangiaceae bacterium]